ncbi:MAG: RNB domain-containing ribonuclease [Planctomycetota bacterium]
MSDPPTRLRGSLSVHPRGFGFVQAEDGASAFVPPKLLRGLLDGDRVEAEVRAEPDGRLTASALERTARWRERLYGTARRAKGGWVVDPDPEVANSPWTLLDAAGLEPGDAVVARLDGDAARLVERVQDPAARELARLFERWGIRRGLDAAQATPQPGIASPGRKDLRAVPTLTIDGPSTKDLDDALSAYPADPEGAVRVLISIADVDAQVAEGSAADLEARRRGTTVYLPGHVEPMLARSLSEDALSLMPEVERDVLTCELRIDPEGRILATDLYPSRIRSDARLTYTGAAAFLDHDDPSEVPAAVHETLRWLRTAAARLSAARGARGGVDMVREEARLELDEAGEALALTAVEETSAHRLVERLMVAANEAVGRWLDERGLPGVYRVHPRPTPERVQALASFAHGFGFEAAFGRELSPRGLRAFEAQFEHARCAPAIYTVLRRALGPARYTTEPGMHFGLAAPLYVHFTSPIRRYPDLLVHRIVKRYLTGDRSQVARDPELEALCLELNALTWRARKAEVERRRALVARYFAERGGERHVAHVVLVRPGRLVAQLQGLGVSGAVDWSELPGEGECVLDERSESCTAPDGSRWTVGDALQVEIGDVDLERGFVDLRLLGRA